MIYIYYTSTIDYSQKCKESETLVTFYIGNIFWMLTSISVMCISTPTYNYGYQHNGEIGICCETIFEVASLILYICMLVIAPMELTKHDCNEILAVIATVEVYFAPVIITVMFLIILILECIDSVFKIKKNRISPALIV